MQLPIGSEDNFKGMVDLVEMKALVWDSDDKDAEWKSLDITPDLADKLHITVPSDRKILDITKYRTELVDTCSGAGRCRDGRRSSPTAPYPPAISCVQMPAQGHVELRVHPGAVRFFVQEQGRAAGAGRRGRLPAGAHRCASIKTVDADGEPIGERKTSDDEPFSALAFKVINDAYGALTFIRVYSGVLTKGASVQNSTRGKREKIGRMVEMFAKEANPVEEARAGDIIALVSLADTETGDTCAIPPIPWYWSACASLSR